IVDSPFDVAQEDGRDEAEVIFGGANLANVTLNLGALGAAGFSVHGFDDSFAGPAVAGAGDVNGDGFDDLVIGSGTSDVGGTDRGEAFVIFGGANLGGAS